MYSFLVAKKELKCCKNHKYLVRMSKHKLRILDMLCYVNSGDLRAFFKETVIDLPESKNNHGESLSVLMNLTYIRDF